MFLYPWPRSLNNEKSILYHNLTFFGQRRLKWRNCFWGKKKKKDSSRIQKLSTKINKTRKLDGGFQDKSPVILRKWSDVINGNFIWTAEPHFLRHLWDYIVNSKNKYCYIKQSWKNTHCSVFHPGSELEHMSSEILYNPSEILIILHQI